MALTNRDLGRVEAGEGAFAPVWDDDGMDGRAEESPVVQASLLSSLDKWQAMRCPLLHIAAYSTLP